MSFKYFNMSFEDHDDSPDIVNTEADKAESTTVREKECVTYIRIMNFKQLGKAKHREEQLQWQVSIPKTDLNASEGTIRVRKTTTKDGKVSYDLTLKNKGKDGSKLETTLPCTEEAFTQLAFLAENGMDKHRYCFPIEGTDMCWEIDVYPDGKAGYYTWGRAELEVKGDIDKLPELPIEVEEVITPEEAQQDDSKVRQLFETYFLKKNMYKVETKAEDAFVNKEDDIDEPTSTDDTTGNSDNVLPADGSTEGDTEDTSQGESDNTSPEAHPSTSEGPTDEDQPTDQTT